MAEFASAIIALAGAGAKVGGRLYVTIRTLKDAPTEFLDLSDEISDFSLMLLRLKEAAGPEEVAGLDQHQIQDLIMLRTKGERIMNEVEILVNKVRKETNEGTAAAVRRIQWLRYASQAKALRERLRAQKVTLSNFIVLSLMSVSSSHNHQMLT